MLLQKLETIEQERDEFKKTNEMILQKLEMSEKNNEMLRQELKSVEQELKMLKYDIKMCEKNNKDMIQRTSKISEKMISMLLMKLEMLDIPDDKTYSTLEISED